MTPASAPPAAIVVHLPAGAATRAIWVERPAGVVSLTRIGVARGVRARASMVVPGVIDVGVDSRGSAPDQCRQRDALDVCTRSQEWCPAPQARWRVTIAKQSGPGGNVRVDFRVGAPT